MSSSPFEIFRRNLKPLMVFLTLLALFSFVVLPALDTYMRRGGGMNSDPVAASFDGTELTRSRVAQTTQNHAAVVRFLYELANLTIERGGVPQTPGFQYDEEAGQIRSVGIDNDPNEEATVNTLRFYNEAKKAGFELDDAAIGSWLTRLTDGKVTDNEIMGLLMRSSGRQLGQQHLYEQLRMHLLADLYQRGSLVGLTNGQLPVVTPLGQWQNFLKTNQKVTVTAYGILASEYLDPDEKPSQSDIEQVFGEGADRLSYPNDESPVPSFRQPDAAQIEFVAANLQDFLDIEKAKISEEQLRTEYERRLAGGDFQLPVGAGDSEPAVDTAAPEEPAEPAAEDSSRYRHADSAVRLVMFQDEEPAAGEAEPVGPEPAAKPEAPSKPEATGKPESPAEPESPSKPETPAKTEPAAETEPAAKTEPAAEQPSEMKEAPAAKAETAKEPVVEAKPAETAQEPAAEPPATEEPAGAKMAEPSTSLELDDEPVQTKPQSFDEVRDQIATEMASDAARQALDQTINEAKKRMRRYFSELAVHESNVSVGILTAADAPKRLDLQKMAAELGLRYGKTDKLVNRVNVDSFGPGKSYGLGSNFNRRGPPYAAMMFGAQMQDGTALPPQSVFSPVQSVDLEEGVSYISWKSEDVPAHTPKLEDAKGDVIEFIQMREARKRAKAAAEELAASLSADDAKLADVVPAGKEPNLIENAGPFSWLEQAGFMQTVVSEVPELDAVGEEFMRAVFSTEIGKHAVAANDLETVYYIVTPTELQPEVEQLREQFRQPQQRFMAQLLGNQDARNIVRGFYQSVDKRTGFEMKIVDQK